MLQNNHLQDNQPLKKPNLMQISEEKTTNQNS